MIKFLLTYAMCCFAMLTYAQRNDTLLRFDQSKWDFGTVAESGGKIQHTYTFVNEHTSPVVIVDVASSCKCAVPDYSKQPIAPGARGELTVVFNPEGLQGMASKTIRVRVSAKDAHAIQVLALKGNITKEWKRTEAYPYPVFEGVYADRKVVVFGNIQQRFMRKKQIVKLYNASARKVVLSHQIADETGCLKISYPSSVPPRTSVDIQLEAFSDKGYYGTLTDKVYLQLGEDKQKFRISLFGTVIDDMRSVSMTDAPHLHIAAPKETSAEICEVFLKNTGNKPLLIRKVEYNPNFWELDSHPASVPPRKSLSLVFRKIKKAPGRNTKDDGNSKDNEVKVISNDPKSPVHRFSLF